MNRQFLSLAVLVTTIGVALPAHAAFKLTIGQTFGTSQVVGLVAAKKGYFDEEGLDVRFKQVPNGNIALGALATENLQFATSAKTPFLAAVSRGIPFVAVGVVMRGVLAELVAAPKYAKLKTLADFKGKRVGVQFGTGAQTVTLMLLQKKHMRSTDFKFTNIRTVDMPAAMAVSNNPFAAVIGWDPFMTRIVDAGAGKVILNAKQLGEEAGVTFPFLLSTTKTFSKAHPEIVQKLVDAYAKGQRYVRAHHDEAIKIFTDAANAHGAKLTPRLVRGMLFDMPRFGGLGFSKADLADLHETIDFLMQRGRLKSKPHLSKCIEPNFAKKAEAAFAD
jgi:aliphatic sulfonates family ABC transporter substrate-binding protein